MQISMWSMASFMLSRAFCLSSATCLCNLLHSGAVVAAVVNTRDVDEACSVLITFEAYLDFFSALFFNSGSLSTFTGMSKFDDALA